MRFGAGRLTVGQGRETTAVVPPAPRAVARETPGVPGIQVTAPTPWSPALRESQTRARGRVESPRSRGLALALGALAAR